MNNERFLAEILNDKISIHDEFYFKGKQLLLDGISVTIRGFNESDTLEHMLHSFFTLYKELFKLEISERTEKFSQKIDLFGDDKFAFNLYENGSLIWKHILTLDELDKNMQDIFVNQSNKLGFPTTHGSPKILSIKLLREGVLRKGYEKVRKEYQNPEIMMTELMEDIKKEITTAHQRSLDFPSEEQYRFLLIAQRLECFGYHYDKESFLKKDFNNIFKNNSISGSIFKDPYQAYVFLDKMTKKISNSALLNEVENHYRITEESLNYKINKVVSFLDSKKVT